MHTYMGHSLKWALKCDMKTKSENLPDNSKIIPDNIRIHAPMKVCVLSCQS